MNLLPSVLDEGIELRLVAEGDAPAMASALVRNRAHLAPWDPERPHSYWTVDGQEEHLSHLLHDLEADACLPFVLTEGERIIGAVTVSHVYRGPFLSGNVGYWLDVEAEGRGLMTRALQEVVAIASEDLRLHRLQAATLIRNARSQRVLRRAGFTEIGVAEGYLQIGGEWQDHVLYQRILY